MKRSLDYWILWGVVAALGVAQIWTASKFFEARNKAVEITSALSAALEEPLRSVVKLDKPIIFNAVISPNETIRVPVSTVIPINTVVEVPLELPIVGEVRTKVPIVTSIPVNLDLNIRLSGGVPITGSTVLDSITIDVALENTPFKDVVKKLKELLGTTDTKTQ